MVLTATSAPSPTARTARLASTFKTRCVIDVIGGARVAPILAPAIVALLASTIKLPDANLALQAVPTARTLTVAITALKGFLWSKIKNVRHVYRAAQSAKIR